MGLWSDKFEIESPGKADIPPFRGFLRLFGNQKYQLHLENTAQRFDVTGAWKVGTNGLTMDVARIQFQNPSELDQQTLKLTVIPVNDIQAAFGRSFILKLDPEEAAMTGLSIRMGPLVGHQVFVKRKLDQG